MVKLTEVGLSPTIRIRLLYFAALRDIAGKREEALILPKGARLKDALRELKRIYGEGFTESISDDRGGRGVFQILVDGERIRPPHGLDLQLTEGSTVAFIPPVVGGSGAPKVEERGVDRGRLSVELEFRDPRFKVMASEPFSASR